MGTFKLGKMTLRSLFHKPATVRYPYEKRDLETLFPHMRGHVVNDIDTCILCGMCQRASLARALVGKPKVLLLDEPLGALDAFTRMNMQDEILRIWKETGMTAIMVTHDVDEAVYLSDKVVVMTPRPGRITGTLDIQLARPRARSSEDFLHYRAEILRQLHYGGTIKEPNYYI